MPAVITVSPVRFTLTYRGQLRGSGGGTAAHKHESQRALHPQLCELWTHEPLSHRADVWLDATSDQRDEAGSALREVAGYPFAVLVQANLSWSRSSIYSCSAPRTRGAEGSPRRPASSTAVVNRC